MRNDATSRSEPNLAQPSDDGLRATTPRASWQGVGLWKVSGLVALVVATSWVVANLASAWLVPPYLAVMALILLPSSEATRRRTEASRSRSAVASPLHSRVRSAVEGSSEPLDLSESSSTPPGGMTDGGATAPRLDDDNGPASATASKGKRGRTRPRKPSKPADPAELAPANWVEVGPGKFVRVESATTSDSVAGPHLLLDLAADLPLFDDDPTTSEPGLAETIQETSNSWAVSDAGTSPPIEVNLRFEPRTHMSAPPADPVVDGVADDPKVTDPTEATDSVVLEPPVPSDHAAAEAGFAPTLDLNVATFDGTAPQVDDVDLRASESDLDPEATRPEVEPGCFDGTFELASEATVIEVESLLHFDEEVEAGAEIAGIRGFESAVDRSRQGFSEVDPEILHEGEVLNEADEASQGDLDVDLGECSGRRRVLPSQAVRRSRVGFDRRFGRRVPSSSLGRTLRPNRRPVDPRRQHGRKVGRPRQITRTSPPRSPPATRSGR